MLYIRHFSFVPYSVEQMFNLINDINSYNEFIPGCNTINIIKKNNNELVAEIVPIHNGIIRSIITHNVFVKNKSIVIFLIESPFKYFYGRWRFFPVSKNNSHIEYISYYEFQSIIIEKMCNYVFQEMYNNIIEIFTARAHQIYGKS